MAPSWLSRHLNVQHITFIHLMAEYNGESCTGTQTTQLFSQMATHLLLTAPTSTPTAPPTFHSILASVNPRMVIFLSPLDYWVPQAKWQDLYSFPLPNSYPCPCYGAAHLTISWGHYWPSFHSSHKNHLSPCSRLLNTFWAVHWEGLFALDFYTWPCFVAYAPTRVSLPVSLWVLLLIASSWPGPALISHLS